MRFELTEEQRDFAATLDDLLAASDTPAVARAWAVGNSEPGLALWSRLASLGVTALLVPEAQGGLGASLVELVIAAEALGHHAVPGPWVESVAWAPLALSDPALLGRLAEGAVATVAAAPEVPLALDADVAELVLVASPDGVCVGRAADAYTSIDPARRLFTVAPGEVVGPADGVDQAFDGAALATAAQLLGAGERVLVESVTYVKQRTQFGRPIGSYQAIKHRLADVRIALDFARPLIYGAALDPTSRNVSAAKVASADAAYLSARAGLQVHGAIGYTQEHDLSLWLLKIRALVSAWGTPAHHRERVLASLLGEAS